MRRRLVYILLTVLGSWVAAASFTPTMPVLRGRSAEDSLRQQGLLDRIKASVEANNPNQNLRASVTANAAQFGEIKKLTASDASADTQFGWSIGISGDTVVVGALNATSPPSGFGAAYIFERNKGGKDNWGEVKKLSASDGAQFGVSVGISGDTVVVGSWINEARKGAAYVFERNKGGADLWGQVRKLAASDGVAGDNFGVSVGISGNTVVVSAHRDQSGKGSAHVFERNQGGADLWGEVKKLIASDGAANDQLGRWIAIDNDIVVVGANGDDNGRGSAYVFERNKGGADNWGEVKKLTASDGAASDQFGRSVSIATDTLVVGAPVHESARGSAYVFERNKGGANNWGEVKRLTASDGAASDFFGYSVGISGDTVVAGGYGDDSLKGSAYTYQRNQGGADNWGEAKKLTASDGAVGDEFGWSVAISGDTAVIGAQASNLFKGSAYSFASQCDQWVEQRKPAASDGSAQDRFGYSVAISGDTVVVGAFRDDSSKGSAYIYERNKTGPDMWGEVRKLTASDGIASDQFGYTVAISGDTIAIGARANDRAKGAAYVFERNKGGADNWGEVRKLTTSDGGSNDFFGNSVGISGDTVVGGAILDDSGRGSVYVFERNKGGVDNWGEVKKLTASDSASADNLGISIAISGDTIVAGASGDDSSKGAAYLFERNKGGADLWGEVRKLSASDGVAGDFFGFNIGISGSTVVAGALDDDSSQGGVYIFERNRGGADLWGEVRKLTASDRMPFDYFSFASISGDTIVVGASDRDSGRGGTYVFERNKGGADNWGEVKKLTASDGAENDFFGFATGISDDTIVIGSYNRAAGKGAAYIFVLGCPVFPEAVSVSAASFQRTALAPEMIAAGFGVSLATGTELAGTIPLPTNLHGTTVSVRDSSGMERLAQIFFVSPGQVNYLLPSGTAAGPATVRITSGSGQISVGMVEVAAISPGFFSANASGQGVAAALVLRVRGVQQVYEQISVYNVATNTFVPVPVDLGPAGDEVYLVMYGTGFRFRSSDSGVNVKVSGRTLQSLFSGIAGGFVGLDQLNVSPLPRDLAGAGVVNIEITIDGKAANTTTLSIK